MIRAILATDEDGGISREGVMPWPKNNDDLRLFSQKTRGHTVVMGSSTWKAKDMPSPLPDRINVVITNDHTKLEPGYTAAYGGKLDRILPMVSDRWGSSLDKEVWIIGGANLIHSCIHMIDEFHISRIEGIYDCDTFLSQDLVDEYMNLSYTDAINNKTTLEVYTKRDPHVIYSG